MKRQRILEVCITVNAMEVRILFDAPPTLEDLVDAVISIFEDNENVRDGLCKLISTLGDSDLIINIGDKAQFSQDDKTIGDLRVQPRTLFENSRDRIYYAD